MVPLSQYFNGMLGRIAPLSRPAFFQPASPAFLAVEALSDLRTRWRHATLTTVSDIAERRHGGSSTHAVHRQREIEVLNPP